MSDAQWLFEYESLKKYENDKFTSYFTVLRRILVMVLGLDAIRPPDENGLPKAVENMTEEEKDMFIPLVNWVGHEHILKTVYEQNKLAEIVAEVDNDKEYEKLVQEIDNNDGDMEPILTQMHNTNK